MLCKVETNRFSDYLPLYQSGEATLGSDEYYQYDVYSLELGRISASPLYWPPSSGSLARRVAWKQKSKKASSYGTQLEGKSRSWDPLRFYDRNERPLHDVYAQSYCPHTALGVHMYYFPALW